MGKRCPCDSKPLTAKEAKRLKAQLDSKPPWVEIDGVAAGDAFGAEGTTAYSGSGAPSAEQLDSTESLSASDVSVHLLGPDEFIGVDGRLYRRVRIKRGGGYLDYSEPAD